MARPALYEAYLRERGLSGDFRSWRKVRVTAARSTAGKQKGAKRRALDLEERIFGNLR